MSRIVSMFVFVTLVGGFGVGCSAMKASTLPPPPITGPNEAVVQVFAANTDDGTTKVLILAWPGWDFEKEVPQARFARYLTVRMEENGCSKPQPLILAPGTGIAFYGLTSDYGNLPSEGVQNMIYWTYCAKKMGFTIPVILSVKSGGAGEQDEKAMLPMTPALEETY